MLSYHWRALAREFGSVELFESGQTQLVLVEPEWVDDPSILALFGPAESMALCLQIYDPIHDRLALVHVLMSEVAEDLDAFTLRVRLSYIGLIESLRSTALGASSAN
jgi:hypothetical protein